MYFVIIKQINLIFYWSQVRDAHTVTFTIFPGLYLNVLTTVSRCICFNSEINLYLIATLSLPFQYRVPGPSLPCQHVTKETLPRAWGENWLFHLATDPVLMIFERISVQFKSPKEADDCSSGHLREKGKRFFFFKAVGGAWNKYISFHFKKIKKQKQVLSKNICSPL